MDGDMKKGVAGRFISYFLFTFILGLFQLIVLYIVLSLKNAPPSIGTLLGDGGIYFFSTSLVFSSLVTLMSHSSITWGSAKFNISVVSIVLTALLAVVSYTFVLSQSPSQTTPFSEHLFSQSTCFFTAASYSIYVCTVTGYWEGN